MTQLPETQFQEVRVPVNLSGEITLRLPTSMHRDEIERIAIDRFKTRLAQPFHMGESVDTSVRFEGEAWGNTGIATGGQLQFEMHHNQNTGVSSAMVALAPAKGTYGADRIRALVSAYVSRETVFITARKSHTTEEKVMVAVQIVDGELTAFLVNAEDDRPGQSPDQFMRIPDFTYQVN